MSRVTMPKKAELTDAQWDWITEVWARKLEDGTYAQTSAGYLCEDRTWTKDGGGKAYCCLGVACVLLRPDGFVGRFPESDRLYFFDETTGEHEDQWLPDVLQHEIGIGARGDLMVADSAPIGALPRGLRQMVAKYRSPSSPLTYMSLTQMNDDGASFAEIAETLRFMRANPHIVWFLDTVGVSFE